MHPSKNIEATITGDDVLVDFNGSYVKLIQESKNT